jgi:zinc and cadmium transporter
VASAIPLVGTLLFAVGARRFVGAIPHLVPFAVGAMLGAAVFHLVPDALRSATPVRVFAICLAGVAVFRVLDRVAHRAATAHNPVSADRSAAAALLPVSIASDGLHNLVDGVLIATTFLTEPTLGVITAGAVALHEIPRELGTFALCVGGGLSVRAALLVNVATAALALGGALAVIALGGGETVGRFGADLVPFTAGAFLYLAGSILWLDRARFTNGMTGLGYLALLTAGLAATALASR